MNREITAFTNLPMPLKVGMLVIAGGSPLAILAAIFRDKPTILWIVFGGLAIVAGLILIYFRLAKWRKKRKATPMERELAMGSSSGTPQGVSDPAKVVQLRDLQDKFKEGVEEFNKVGKSLYSLPWYMIVGEPGSGKTKAIANSRIGFPKHLTDQLQGTGGTINMHWWFTDHAVILDTAGRLMFEEVESGGSKEWKEFLNLLKRGRPRCPINGVLLVIPADSLIKDTADEIEQKASKIARQFDVIQRTLDVRFPVFVVITKSDLISGFREFFADLQDPQLQDQILGWSNPESLDTPFSSSFVEKHRVAIEASLFRRRLMLLRDLVAERARDETSSTPEDLYAFPRSLDNIAPRMTRYLELIFSVGSQWTCKPLFFRGIYFTSAMEEGLVLDEDLAEALGVSVESLPGDDSSNQRACFLRDFFMKKVFPEQGLVTAATSAKKQHQRRKAGVMLSAIFSIVLLLCFVYYSHYTLEHNIGRIYPYFANLSTYTENGKPSPTAAKKAISVIDEDYQYRGKFKIESREEPNGMPSLPKKLTRANVHARLNQAVNQYLEEDVPLIYRPAIWFSSVGGLGFTPDELRKAQATLYEVGVIKPFVEAAQGMMSNKKGGKWTRTDPNTLVLHQLIQVYAQKHLDDSGDYSATHFFDSFSELVLLEKQKDLYGQDKKLLHAPIREIYDPNVWPPVHLFERQGMETAITQGIECFNQFWTDPDNASNQDSTRIAFIKDLEEVLKTYGKTESRLLELEKEGLDLLNNESRTLIQINDYISRWTEGFSALGTVRLEVKSCIENASEEVTTLKQMWDQAAATASSGIKGNYAPLLDSLHDVNEGPFLGGIRSQLLTAQTGFEVQLSAYGSSAEFKQLDSKLLTDVNGVRIFEDRFEMYSKTNAYLEPRHEDATFMSFNRIIEEVNKAYTSVHNQLNDRYFSGQNDPNVPNGLNVCNHMIALAWQRDQYRILKTALDDAPKKIGQLRTLVEKSNVDLTHWDIIPREIQNAGYSLHMTGKLLDTWSHLGDALKANTLKETNNLKTQYQTIDSIYTSYREQCLGYWVDTVPKALITPLDDVNIQIKKLLSLKDAIVNFGHAEEALLLLQTNQLADNKNSTLGQNLDYTSRWTEKYLDVNDARMHVRKCVEQVGDVATLSQSWNQAVDSASNKIKTSHESLLTPLHDVNEDSFLGEVRQKLSVSQQNFITQLNIEEVLNEFGKLDENHFREFEGNRLFRARSEMYAQTHAYLMRDPNVLKMMSFARTLEEHSEALRSTRDKVKRHHASRRQDHNMDKALELCKSTLTLAQKTHLYHIVEEAIAVAPTTVEKFEALVSDEEGTEPQWDWGTIPNDIRDSQYNPLHARNLLDNCQALGDELARGELPEMNNFKATYDEVHGACATYRKKYLTYWVDDVPGQFIPLSVKEHVKIFQSKLTNRVISENLEGFGKSVERALDQFIGKNISSTSNAKVTTFRASLELLRNPTSKEESYVTSFLKNWRRLRGNLETAHLTLLDLEPVDFRSDYMFYDEYESNADFVKAYWVELTNSLFDEIQVNVQTNSRDAFEILKKYGRRFPLERFVENRTQADLTLKDLSLVRDQVSKVQPQKQFGNRTIGGGALTNIRGLDARLAQLKGVSLSEEDNEWFSRIRQVLKCLPSEADQNYFARVTILSYGEQVQLAKAKEEVLLLEYYRSCKLIQGNGQSDWYRTDIATDTTLDFRIQYPSFPDSNSLLPVLFFESRTVNQGDKVDLGQSAGKKTFRVDCTSKGWECLELWHKFHDRSNRRKNCLKFKKVDEETKKVSVFYMLLQFYRDYECTDLIEDFPEPDAWPSLRN